MTCGPRKSPKGHGKRNTTKKTNVTFGLELNYANMTVMTDFLDYSCRL